MILIIQIYAKFKSEGICEILNTIISVFISSIKDVFSNILLTASSRFLEYSGDHKTEIVEQIIVELKAIILLDKNYIIKNNIFEYTIRLIIILFISKRCYFSLLLLCVLFWPL